MNSNGIQTFGGAHTERKLDIFEQYVFSWLNVMQVNLSGKRFYKIYIDGLAGSGQRKTKTSNVDNNIHSLPDMENFSVIRAGSAIRVAELEKKFDECIFIDIDQNNLDNLKENIGLKNKPSMFFECGDVNEILQEKCKEIRKRNWEYRQCGWLGVRMLIFLDPYGLQLDWETLEVIAKTGIADVWFLFPISGLTRLLARDLENIQDSRQNKIAKALGDNSWKNTLYTSNTIDLFDQQKIERPQGYDEIDAYVKKRFETIFKGYVSDPIPIITQSGLRLFSMFFLMSNTSPNAVKIGKNLVESITKKHPKNPGLF